MSSDCIEGTPIMINIMRGVMAQKSSRRFLRVQPEPRAVMLNQGRGMLIRFLRLKQKATNGLIRVLMGEIIKEGSEDCRCQGSGLCMRIPREDCSRGKAMTMVPEPESDDTSRKMTIKIIASSP